MPKNPNLRQEWINAIKCENFKPLPHWRICSKHFSSDCFVESPWNSKRILKADAVPTVSDVSEMQHIHETDILNVPCIEMENEIAKYNSLYDQC